MRQLRRRPVQKLMIEQNTQNTEHILFAAAVETREMLRRKEAVPGDVAQNL
jgi:hypothetical protein